MVPGTGPVWPSAPAIQGPRHEQRVSLCVLSAPRGPGNSILGLMEDAVTLPWGGHEMWWHNGLRLGIAKCRGCLSHTTCRLHETREWGNAVYCCPCIGNGV